MPEVTPVEGHARRILATDGTSVRFEALSSRGQFWSDDPGDAWVRVAADQEAVYSGQVPRGLAVV